MVSNKDIVFIFDFDETLTEENQQVPLFRRNFEKIKKKVEAFNSGILKDNPIELNEPNDYFKIADTLYGGVKGISYLEAMIDDAKKGGCFEGLTNELLYDLGKYIVPAPGLSEGLLGLKEEFKNRANIHYFIVSVGLKPLIQGFLDYYGLSGVIDQVRASEFRTDEDGIIIGIKNIVLPFTKTQHLISIMKGSDSLLDVHKDHQDYKYDYFMNFVWGDGRSDISKFTFDKKQGGTPGGVYRAFSQKDFKRLENDIATRVDIEAPRDYSRKGMVYQIWKEEIERKLGKRCGYIPFHALYELKKTMHITPFLKEHVLPHVESCTLCQDYFRKIIITPDNKVIRKDYNDFLKEKEDLANGNKDYSKNRQN